MHTTIYLARHASPDWTRQDLVYHLPPGPPLTPRGLREAQELGAFLRLARVRRILTSPLERCQHTATIAGDIVGVTPTTVEALHEVQPAESRETLWARLWPVFQDVWQQQAANGQTPAALVTHGGPIMALLSALGIDQQAMEALRIYDHRNVVPPAGVWEVTWDPADGRWQLQLAFTPSLNPPV